MYKLIRKQKQLPRLSKEEQDYLLVSSFAFPREPKEPLEDASHVRDALARFDQVEEVRNQEHDIVWKCIQRKGALSR